MLKPCLVMSMRAKEVVSRVDTIQASLHWQLPDEVVSVTQKPNSTAKKTNPNKVHLLFQSSGDTRWALAPVLAYQYYEQQGSPWKWMLMGDDDTVFFMHGA